VASSRPSDSGVRLRREDNDDFAKLEPLVVFKRVALEMFGCVAAIPFQCFPRFACAAPGRAPQLLARLLRTYAPELDRREDASRESISNVSISMAIKGNRHIVSWFVKSEAI
jgi:hypothetical protein